MSITAGQPEWLEEGFYRGTKRNLIAGLQVVLRKEKFARLLDQAWIGVLDLRIARSAVIAHDKMNEQLFWIDSALGPRCSIR